jgi:hypothetical protein
MDTTLRSIGQQLGVTLAQKLGYTAGAPAANQASQLLSQILGSVFQGGKPAPVSPDFNPASLRLPSPINQFGGQLRQLGVLVQTLGEVLKSLSALIGQRNLGQLPQGPSTMPFPGQFPGQQPGGPIGIPGFPSNPGTGQPPVAPGHDFVSENMQKYLSQMSPEQQAMWHLQQSQNKQAEAAALMAALLKAAHDATQGILQKI